MSRPEVFDVRCNLHFYSRTNSTEQWFLAVPEDSTVKLVLRGVFPTKIPAIASRGRLLGIRKGLRAGLWPEEAAKVNLPPGWDHDLVEHCIWEPDRIEVPDRAIAYWPTSIVNSSGMHSIAALCVCGPGFTDPECRSLSHLA